MVTQTIEVATTTQECRAIRRAWQDQTIALVPTMGALHEGHLALMRLAKEKADRVVVSVFVNPLQFGPHEDYQNYPRMFEADKAACADVGVDLIFCPRVEVLYPRGIANTTVVVPSVDLTDRWCGLSRPGHFTGVATVVLKLFHIIEPDIAIFGEKDAQQLAVIRAMVSDLMLPVEILGHPIVREASGLAMSSRNKYFKNPQELESATLLIRILRQIREKYEQEKGEVLSQPLFDSVLAEHGGKDQGERFRLEYLEAVDSTTFSSTPVLKRGCKLLIAAKVHGVRLIDNLDL